MNHSLFLNPFSPPLLSILLLASFLLARKSVSAIDSQFLACNPQTCGDQNITFPFFIENQQKDFCGFPGFGVICNNGRPILRLENNNYTIHHISYEIHTLRVSNSNTSLLDCVPPFQNTSFSSSDKFKLTYNQTDLVLLYNCNSTRIGLGNSELLKYRVNCSSDSGSDWSLAMFKGDPLLGSASGVCGNAAETAVDVERGGESGGIQRMLERGFLLNWVAANCSLCQRSGGKCGFDFKLFQFQCFCPDRPHFKSCVSGSDRLALKLGLALGIGVFIIILLSFFVLGRYIRRHGLSNLMSTFFTYDLSSKSEIEVGSAYYGIPIFSYTDLQKATSNFDNEKELGDGGYGTVYYGKLKDGREVAVKRLYEHNCKRVEQFLNEIQILTRLRHKNLVSLYGCTSRQSRELLLVYEYIPNGTVADHLHGDRANSSPLSWPIRMSIAIATAGALAYLHASDIIHRDVKTSNILLDNNFCVKVADFGLSRLFPFDVTHVSTAPQGTPGYVDPEYYKCYQLTDKSDVYSFGVVLVELVSSKPAVDISRNRDEINLANLAINRVQKCVFDELIDPCFWCESGEEVRGMTIAVAELAFRCLQPDKELRPAMDEVLAELKEIQCKETMEVVQFDNMESGNMLPPASPPNCVEASLLKNIRLPTSPDTVTTKWSSSYSTTPNASR